MAKEKTSETIGTDITPEDSVAPVYLVELTVEEIAEREQWAAEEIERGKAQAAREKARTAALSKLKKLGLTDAEIDALIN